MPSKIRRAARPAEKLIPKTDKTMPVAAEKTSRRGGKTVGAAIDHRRQLVGTDEPRGRSEKARRR